MTSYINSFNVSPTKKQELTEFINQERKDKEKEMMKNIYFNKTYTNSFLDNPKISLMKK